MNNPATKVLKEINEANEKKKESKRKRGERMKFQTLLQLFSIPIAISQILLTIIDFNLGNFISSLGWIAVCIILECWKEDVISEVSE